MQIRLNGEPTEVPDGLTVTGLVTHINLRPERVAVERNRLVVRRVDWDRQQLASGDEIEVLTFVGGG